MMNGSIIDKKWFAVYTRSQCEKKVAALLAKKGIDHYCPLNKVVRQWSDRKKTILEPLFKSYVFVRIHEREALDVLKTDGVINFVHWLQKPAVIRDEEIDAIKQFMLQNENVQLEKTEVRVNDQVKIIYGPFIDRYGKVVEVEEKTVKLILPALGYALVVKVPKERVRFLTKKREGVRKPSVAI
jgi:Transcription antiterminator